MGMEKEKIKEDLESVIEVLSNVFEPKQNAITDYVLPILKDVISYVEEN